VNVRALLAIALTDLRRSLRRKDTILWLLLMPLPYTWFFGTAFQEAPERPTPVNVVAPAPDPGTSVFVQALEREGYEVTVLEGWNGDGEFPDEGFRVDLPATPADTLLAGGSAPIAVHAREVGPDLGRLEVTLSQAALELQARALAVLIRDGHVEADDLAEPPPAPPVRVEAEDWGPRRSIPSGFKQSIPGNMVMFVLMAVLVTGAVRLVQDRELGHLRRMLSFPVGPGTVVAAQFASLGLLGLVEAFYFLAVSRLVFGQSPGDHPWAVAAVLAALVAVATGAAILLASALSSLRRTVAAGLFLTLLAAALGGCWWPMEILPRWMKAMALALPTGQTMQALVRLTVWNDPPGAVLPNLAYLLVLAAILGFLAARRLRSRIA